MPLYAPLFAYKILRKTEWVREMMSGKARKLSSLILSKKKKVRLESPKKSDVSAAFSLACPGEFAIE